MKKYMRIAALALMFVLLAALPLAAQKTEYQIGESEGGLLNDGKLKDAIQSAVDKFEDWMYEGVPSGYVTKTDDYYLQPYTDGEDRTAAVYVGPDYKSYVLRGPIYEQIESVGGFEKLGRPVSDAYEVNGVWYQNFDRGYATVDDSGKATFVEGKQVNENGTVSSGTGGAGTGTVTTDRTDNATGRTDNVTDNSVPSPSEMVSDVVSDVTDAAEEVTSNWGVWVFVILLLLAIVVLAVYWFLKRR